MIALAQPSPHPVERVPHNAGRQLIHRPSVLRPICSLFRRRFDGGDLGRDRLPPHVPETDLTTLELLHGPLSDLYGGLVLRLLCIPLAQLSMGRHPPPQHIVLLTRPQLQQLPLLLHRRLAEPGTDTHRRIGIDLRIEFPDARIDDIAFLDGFRWMRANPP